jgi:hypothetical protein
MKGTTAGKGDLRKMMRSALAQKKQEKKISSPLVRYHLAPPRQDRNRNLLFLSRGWDNHTGTTLWGSQCADCVR